LQKRMTKIMIVEDEAVVALRLQQRLTSMGFDIVGVAYSGEEAVETARDLRPDLILTDIMIPGKLDGIQVAEIVKSVLDIPVIFLTAYPEDKIIERIKQAEPYGYIVKPFQDRELKDAIEVALYKKDMERQLKESKI
jgi:CheY-like chemotaxis protein